MSPEPVALSRDVPLLERWGVRVLHGRGQRSAAPGEPIDEVHELNPSERKALRSIVWWTVVRAGMAGALSTVVSGLAEMWIAPRTGGGEGSTESVVAFWGVVGGATIVASAFEIGFLYWDGLRSVHRLSEAAGLSLFSERQENESLAVARAMARAALELPNPAREVMGVDPRRESSKFALVVASLAYKLKISVSNFLAKMLVRRVLGRALVRTWLPLVAVPITAAWNAVIAWRVVREARIRAMGPSFAREAIRKVTQASEPLGPAERRAWVRGVASAIMKKRDMHPNLETLLRDVLQTVELDEAEASDNADSLMRSLGELDADARARVLVVLALAIVADGRVSRRERSLFSRAREVSGLPAALDALDAFGRAFARGDGVSKEALERLGRA